MMTVGFSAVAYDGRRWSYKMKTKSIRIRVAFDDPSVLSQTQRTNGMDHSWFLIEPNKHLKISDVSNRLLQVFSLRCSCPNGILLFMEGFFLPPSESTQLLKDKDIIRVKRKELALAEAADVEDGGNLLDEQELNRTQPVDNCTLLLANEEFDKETGGYESESEEDEDEKLDEPPSPKDKVSKKRKASTKLRSPKKKKKRSVVMDGVEDEVATEDDNIIIDECFPSKIICKKVKSKKEKGGESETINSKIKSPSKEKRRKKHRLGLVSGAEDEVVTDEIGKVNNADGVKQESTAPDGVKKGPSRSARRKKAKRQWRQELAKMSQNPPTHLEPEASEVLNKEANGHPDGLLKQDQFAAKPVIKNVMEQVERIGNGSAETKLVPCVVRPGHIRFESLDKDEDAKHIEVPNVAFQWNGITSKKKGQKWGLEKFSTFQRNDSQKEDDEPSKMLTADAQPPLIDLNKFDQLPLCSSPKEGDVIAYRLIELSSSWTPELSSFRVGKVSHCDTNSIVLMPVPDYPIVFDKMDEDGPDNSLYKEDGSLEITLEALLDVRSVKQSNSHATTAVSNGVSQAPHGENKDAALKQLSSNNANKTNLSEDPSPVVMNKQGDTWDELSEALRAKKLELSETNEEMKKDSGRNKWSYRALRGGALGPTMAMLRSTNNI